jgi:hypothetical protein
MTRHALACVALLALLASAPADDADERALREAKVGTDGPALLQFFRSRTLDDDDRARILALVRKLGNDSFAVRERASEDLVAAGAAAESLLREAKRDPDPEIARRAEECLQRITRTASPSLIAAAARLLAARKPDGAAEALLAFVPHAADDYVADEVRDALAAVALRDGKPDPDVVAALADKDADRRAAAGTALARAEADDLRAAVRKLLDDPEAEVRLHVALALAFARDRQAVPELIDLLGELPPEDAWRAEDVLRALAAEKAPTVPLGRDEAGREKCRDAWAGWWEKHGEKADLARLDREALLLGHTLVVQRDLKGTAGRVAELGRDGTVRWEIEGLRGPLDAQVLPGGRVLVSEYTSRRVTERDQKGEVLWEFTAPTTLVGAQRLPGGGTFVACRNGYFEVDAAGKQSAAYTRPTADVTAARRLRGGETVLLTTGGECVRLDAAGKEVSRFPVGRVATYGGFDALPGGRVLVPIYAENRVVEYDGGGKVVWEAAVQRPTSAVRLPNGNVLIASSVGRRLVELDRAGKEVWQLPVEGRPYKAYRR